MVRDISYKKFPTKKATITHQYGENVHIVSTPYLMSVLARVCHAKTQQPEFNSLIQTLYKNLFENVVNELFPTNIQVSPTRMKAHHPEGELEFEGIDTQLKVVMVDIARAGTIPSQVGFDFCHNFLLPENIRQDHIYCNRKVNEQGQVIGVTMSGSKIGGDVDKTIVLIPDPMGATGGTIDHVIKHYKQNVQGKALFFAALHMIVTPEYITRMKREHPDLHIFAIRLDRGLSSDKVLNSIPGTFISEETGLNQFQYIVPGGGGFGELMNNTPH